MMKILPPQTNPPETPIDLKHSPPKYESEFGYQNFRNCLRWDFGFTCAFCLLHESDFMPLGTEGSGIMQIEHWIPKSAQPDQKNEFDNCRYICKFCNQSRGAKAVHADEGKLLDPCEVIWRDHFHLSDDKLVVNNHRDVNGLRTKNVYELNDPRKIRRRMCRKKRLSELIEIIKEGEEIRKKLQKEAQNSVASDPEKRQEKLSQAQELDKIIRQSKKELTRFQTIPDDHPEECKCQEDFELPSFLQRQSTPIDLS